MNLHVIHCLAAQRPEDFAWRGATSSLQRALPAGRAAVAFVVLGLVAVGLGLAVVEPVLAPVRPRVLLVVRLLPFKQQYTPDKEMVAGR